MFRAAFATTSLVVLSCAPDLSELEDVRISVRQVVPGPGATESGYPAPSFGVEVLSHEGLLAEGSLDFECPDLGGLTVRVDGERLRYQPSTIRFGDSVFRCGGSFFASDPPEAFDEGRIVISDAKGDHAFEVPSLREPFGLAVADGQPVDVGGQPGIRFALSPWAAPLAGEGTEVDVYTYSEDYSGWLHREELRSGSGLAFDDEGFTAIPGVRGRLRLHVGVELNALACERSAFPCGAARSVRGEVFVDVP